MKGRLKESVVRTSNKVNLIRVAFIRRNRFGESRDGRDIEFIGCCGRQTNDVTSTRFLIGSNCSFEGEFQEILQNHASICEFTRRKGFYVNHFVINDTSQCLYFIIPTNECLLCYKRLFS